MRYWVYFVPFHESEPALSEVPETEEQIRSRAEIFSDSIYFSTEN